MHGWHPDRRDTRDDVHTERLMKSFRAAAPLPPSFDGRQVRPQILDQGAEGRCTGHGWRGVWMAYAIRSGKQEPDRSPQFIYDLERHIDGVPLTEDSGAQIRDGAKALLFYGACSEPTWPSCDPSNWTQFPSHQALAEAAIHKVPVAYRLPDLNAIKRSIADRYPVVFGFTCFDSLQSDAVAQTGNIPYPLPHEPTIGGHCMVADSFADDHVIGNEKGALMGPNSWGDGWGNAGGFALPYRYVVDGLASDFWTVRAVAL